MIISTIQLQDLLMLSNGTTFQTKLNIAKSDLKKKLKRTVTTVACFSVIRYCASISHRTWDFELKSKNNTKQSII